MLMYPTWAYMLCLFKMRRLRLTALKSVTQCTQGSGRRISVNSSPSCSKAAAECWWVTGVERGRQGNWKMGTLLWKLCRKADAKLNCDNLTLVGRCRGGNTGQGDRWKYSRGPSVNATVSCAFCKGPPCPSILPVFEDQGEGGCSA